MSTTPTANESQNTSFYVNMDFAKLVKDINQAENPGLVTKFNGKGQKVTYILGDLEKDYFNYSSDAERQKIITPPFNIRLNDTVTCTLQSQADDTNLASCKWKDIIQSEFDLQLVEKSNGDGKAVVTYKAIKLTTAEQDDDVIINISFKYKNEAGEKVKYYVSWDPQIIVKR
jgi:hypothetical protein